MMIDVLMGFRATADRALAAGPEAASSRRDPTKPHGQEPIKKVEQGVNNRAEKDDRSGGQAREDSFDDALTNAAEQKSPGKEPPSASRDMRPSVGFFASMAAEEAGLSREGTAEVVRFLDMFAGNDAPLFAMHDGMVKAARSSDQAIGGILKTALQETRQFGSVNVGGSLWTAAGALAGLDGEELLTTFYSRLGQEPATLVEAPQIRTSAPETVLKLQQDMPAWVQQALQRLNALTSQSGAPLGVEGGADLLEGNVEFIDADGEAPESTRLNYAKLFQQLQLAGFSSAAPSMASAFATFMASQAVASGDLKGVTELGPVEFGAAKLHEALVQTAAPAHQAAAPTQAVTAQIVAAIRADRIGNTVEVRLDPPELGRVRIEFAVETAEAVRAVVTAERAETLDHLRRNAAHLAEELRSAGFASIDLEFSNRDETGFGAAGAEVAMDVDGDPMAAPHGDDMVYLTLRDNARLNMLV